MAAIVTNGPSMIYVPAPGGAPGDQTKNFLNGGAVSGGTQPKLLNGVSFPKFGISGFNNIMNGVTFPTLPAVSGVSVDSLRQNVTTPSVPAVTTPSVPAVTTPATPKDDSSMNWLWILIIIPIGIAGAAAMSKSK